MKRSKSHLSLKGYGWSSLGVTLALGITLLLLSATVASLLVSARAGSVQGVNDSHRAVTGLHQASSLDERSPHALQTESTGYRRPFTGSITATALLPILVNGYPPSYPWTGEIVATYPNCTLIRLFGFVLNQYDEPVGDIWVHIWADNFEGYWKKSSWEVIGDNNWDGTVDNRPRDVLWYACVVPEKKSWDCQSNTVEAPTSDNCETGIQVYHIDFRQN